MTLVSCLDMLGIVGVYGGLSVVQSLQKDRWLHGNPHPFADSHLKHYLSSQVIYKGVASYPQGCRLPVTKSRQMQ